METLGIYVHIPFCKKKCDYCDFYSVCDLSDRLMDSYLDALTEQIKEYFMLHKPLVDTIYIGGGTPSVFGGKRIEKLLKELKNHVQLTNNPEITVEVNPESVDDKLCKRLRSAGVNRISMGVQSADDGQLQALGRLHDFAGAEAAYRTVRKYFDNISLDLIYALEGQTLESWMDSLEKVAALGPDHISCYCLKVEDGTPLASRGCVQPDEDIQADMYLKAVDYLAEKGYEQYEISNFARGGKISRHNSKYWDLSEYLGLGCAAHSFYGGRRFSFIKDVNAFIKGVLGKQPIAEDVDEVAYISRPGEYVMLKLRTTSGIDPDEFERRFSMSFKPYEDRLERYIANGFAEKKLGRYSLTPKGFLVSNIIIGDLVNGVCGI